MTVIIDFLEDTEGDVVSNAFLFYSAFICMLYLILYEWYVYERLSSNIFCIIALFMAIIQSIKCILINLKYNQLINVLLGILMLSLWNISNTIMILNVKFKTATNMNKFMYFMVIIVTDIMAFVLNYIYGFTVIAPIYFLFTWAYCMVSYIVIFRQYKNKKIRIMEQGNNNKDVLSFKKTLKILFLHIFLMLIVGPIADCPVAISAAVSPIFRALLTFVWFPVMTLQAIHVGQMDFICNNDYNPVTMLDPDVNDLTL